MCTVYPQQSRAIAIINGLNSIQYHGGRFRGLTENTPFSYRYFEVLGQKISFPVSKLQYEMCDYFCFLWVMRYFVLHYFLSAQQDVG